MKKNKLVTISITVILGTIFVSSITMINYFPRAWSYLNPPKTLVHSWENDEYFISVFASEDRRATVEGYWLNGMRVCSMQDGVSELILERVYLTKDSDPIYLTNFIRYSGLIRYGYHAKRSIFINNYQSLIERLDDNYYDIRRSASSFLPEALHEFNVECRNKKFWDSPS